ncbi:MAG TPA: sigma factor-like helix-turn-helix DNA-binding protein, partial [Rudaea sp.]
EQVRRRHRNEIVGSDLDEGDDADFLLAQASPAPSPTRQAHGEQIRRRVDEELTRMSVIERTAFVMRHAEGQSLADISQALSLNVGACKQAIFRAVRKLRGALQPLR